MLLPLLAPAIDIATLYAIVSSPGRRGLSWCGWASSPCSCVAAAYAFRLDGERLGPLWSLPLQQFVYRQLMYLVVIQSVASALYGFRLRWQVIRRTGEMDSAPVTATRTAAI